MCLGKCMLVFKKIYEHRLPKFSNLLLSLGHTFWTSFHITTWKFHNIFNGSIK